MEPRVETKPDRRVQRTHRLLRDALIALVLERGWDDVGVQDICERADVGRSTFYSHFGDKEELLISGFEGLHRELTAHVRLRADAGRLTFVRPLLAHCAENRPLFRALVGRRAGQVVQRRFRALLVDMVRDDLVGATPPAAAEATAHFVAGALFELVTWWLDAPTAMTPVELDTLFQRLATGAIGDRGAPRT